GGNVETNTAGAITIGSKAIISGGVVVHGAGAKVVSADATVGNYIVSSCPTAAPNSNWRMIKSRSWRQLFVR
ncbi:hypothetical protein ACVBEH_31380, partial [Roseateles sp. GG27B]